MITYRGQIKVKKQSKKNRILHPVWQMTRKKTLEIMFSRDFARCPTWPVHIVHPTVDLA